jgi:hypothetical protein
LDVEYDHEFDLEHDVFSGEDIAERREQGTEIREAMREDG